MQIRVRQLRVITLTSSTAQGGGGSFKNRKPIGEVGCCESRMAERSHWWTDRWLGSPLFLSLSFSFSDYLPTYRPISLWFRSIYLPIHRSIDLSIYLLILSCLVLSYLIYLSIYLYRSLSIYLSLSLSIYLSLYLSISLSLYLSIYLYRSLSLSIYLSNLI